MKRVLVTGATGFVGSTLCDVLIREGYRVRVALRADWNAFEGAEKTRVGDISGTTDWSAALQGVDFVIHAAARAHVLRDSKENAALYFTTNVDGTRTLANASALAGVRRLVFLSSVKVNGERTKGQPFTPLDGPHPEDAYGESKRLAEIAIMEACETSAMESVIVRSPLVYGPGVRANFLRLLRWVDKELPLPLGAVHNRRSLVSIWNLCALLVNVLENPAASRRTWMVSDGQDISTPELIRQLSVCMHRRARLLAVPSAVLLLLGALTGRRAEVARLCGSLVVDISATRRDLGWEPPLPLHEGLSRTVEWYRSLEDGSPGRLP